MEKAGCLRFEEKAESLTCLSRRGIKEGMVGSCSKDSLEVCGHKFKMGQIRAVVCVPPARGV